MSPIRHRVISAIVALSLLTSLKFPTAQAQGVDRTGATSQGRQWALLVGCERYQKVNPLRYIVNDVREVATTLRNRGGVDPECVLEMTDESEGAMKPLKVNLMDTLPRWLARLGPDDRLILYFSGHGFRDASNKLYLAPLDCDKHDLIATAIPADWFRQQLAACKATFKLLILDACHAGEEKGEDDDPSSVSAGLLGDVIRADQTGIATLASSSGDERSQIWAEKRHSLFTYWLNLGLKGNADENGNGAVDIDELNEYVYDNVVRTSKNHFPRPQTPARVVRSGVKGVPMVIRLQPQNLNELLGDVAEQLALSMEDNELKRVGVPEFTCERGKVEFLGGDLGNLGKRCAEKLESKLAGQSRGKFKVTDGRLVRKAMQEQKFRVADLGSSDALRALSSKLDGLPVLAEGTIRSRVGGVMTLQCRLVRIDTEEVVAASGGVALLDVNQWGETGRSIAVKPDDRQPEMPDPSRPVRPADTQLIDHLEPRANGPHPLTDPSFPYPVRVIVNGQVRRLIPRGNEMLLPVRPGDVYKIEVENRTNTYTMMRLLVDGLNTLPQRESTKGIVTEFVGEQVSLGEARPHVLAPRSRSEVSGFASRTGRDGSVADFTIARVETPQTERQVFNDQVGLITIGFYDSAEAPPVSIPRGDGLRTIPGKTEKVDLTNSNLSKVGPVRAIVNIRYVDANALAQTPLK